MHLARISLVLGVLASAACIYDTDPPRRRVVLVETAQPFGTLTVRWSIAGTRDASQCARLNAPTIEIRILDPAATRELSAWQQSCEFFATTITLERGTYSARALLLDPTLRPRTTEVPIAPFSILGNDVVEVAVEFPSDSFL